MNLSGHPGAYCLVLGLDVQARNPNQTRRGSEEKRTVLKQCGNSRTRIGLTLRAKDTKLWLVEAESGENMRRVGAKCNGP